MPFRQPGPSACPFRVEQDQLRGIGVSTRRGPRTTDGRQTRGSRNPTRCDDRRRRGSDGGGGRRPLGGTPATTAGTSPGGTNRNETRYHGKKRGRRHGPRSRPRRRPGLFPFWGSFPFPRGLSIPVPWGARIQTPRARDRPRKHPGAGRPPTPRDTEQRRREKAARSVDGPAAAQERRGDGAQTTERAGREPRHADKPNTAAAPQRATERFTREKYGHNLRRARRKARRRHHITGIDNPPPFLRTTRSRRGSRRRSPHTASRRGSSTP